MVCNQDAHTAGQCRGTLGRQFMEWVASRIPVFKGRSGHRSLSAGIYLGRRRLIIIVKRRGREFSNTLDPHQGGGASARANAFLPSRVIGRGWGGMFRKGRRLGERLVLGRTQIEERWTSGVGEFKRTGLSGVP